MKAEKMTKEELLKLEGKYIFHGSEKLFDIALPHQAKCDTKKKENEQFAIYGSPDLNFSIVFAFPKSPYKKYRWSCKFVNGKYVGVLHDDTYIEEDSKGYLYCFDKTKFEPTEKGSAQYVCKKPLKPELILEVAYKDFKENFINDFEHTL